MVVSNHLFVVQNVQRVGSVAEYVRLWWFKALKLTFANGKHHVHVCHSIKQYSDGLQSLLVNVVGIFVQSHK